MKKSLLLHHDFYRMFKLLTEEEAGRLIMAVFEYEVNGVMTEFDDRLLSACYIRITECLDRNNERYDEIRLKRIEAARKRWEKERKTMI